MAVLVSVVGRIAVEHDGGRVDGGALLARRTRLLLVSLACHGGTLSAPALADRLWTTPPATWPAALRGAVAALRAALAQAGLDGQHLVVTEPSGWRLADGAVTDLALAERALAEAEGALARGRPGTALERASSAAAATEGEVLPDDDAAWIDALRGRRSSTSARALAVVADAALALGDAGRAVEAGLRLLHDAPLDETAHRRLIRAHLAAGDRASALRAFERCRAVLAEELGLDPDDETAALHLEVLRAGPGSVRTPPLPVDRFGGRFVGRAAEVAEVRDALARGRWVTLVGQGGIGKSRLALQVAHDPAVTADGRCWAGLGDVADSALVPSLVAAAVGAEGALDPLAGVVERLAPAGSTLLVLDGCEQHRDALADLVPQLLEQVPGLVVLCTSRTRLGGASERRVAVGALDASDAGVALLTARLAEGPSSRRLAPRDAEAARRLCALVGGVPLAIELAAARLHDQAVEDLLDEASAETGGPGVDGGDPAAVLERLADQGYRALDPQEARVLRALAAVDGVVPLALVRATAGQLPGPRVARALGALAEAGFVVVDRDGARWRYGVDAHLRPLARSWSTPQERRDDLTTVGEALGAVVPADATAPPGPHRTGVDAAVDGLRSVFAAAADDVLPREPALALAFRLHRHWASTGVAEGRHWLGRLLDGAAPSPEAARARFAAGYLAYWAGDAAGLPLLRRAGEELADDEPAFAARALLYAGGLSDDLDEPDRALDEVTRAVALARRVGGGLVASVELGFASVLAERGAAAAVDAVAAVERALALLPDDAPPPQRAAIAATGALAAWRAGGPSGAATADRLRREAEALLADEPSISRAVLAMAAAGSALVAGDPARAGERAAAALDDLQQTGADREVPLAAALAARAAADLGDADGARSAALLAVRAASGLGVPAAAALALEAVLAARPDHPSAALLAASATRIRAVGHRPAPPGLAPSSRSGTGHEVATAVTAPLDPAAALALADS